MSTSIEWAGQATRRALMRGAIALPVLAAAATARRAGEIIKAAGQAFDYVSLPDAAHAMHQAQPARFATVVGDWAKKLPA